MSFYDAFKDAISVAQKADNVELYRQLLDLSAQALDLQAEVARLREENHELKKSKDISEKIIRHEEPVVTIDGDEKRLYYCSHCWDSQQLLIQINCHIDGTFNCPHCQSSGNYDNEKKKKSDIANLEAIAAIGNVGRKTLNR